MAISPFPPETLLTLAGDPQQVFVATAGQQINISVGTAASPNTSPNPVLKAVQQVSMPRASVTGDGAEQMAAVLGIDSGDANNQVQTVGVMGGAIDAGTSGGGGSPDACGVYGIGRIVTLGIGTGIGAFLQGRVDSTAAAAKANGCEVRCTNNSTVAGTLTAAGFSNYTGVWVNCDGNANSSVALAFGNPFGFQWTTGIFFNAQVNGGFTGGILTTAIRDDCNSVNGIILNGTKTGVAIGVSAASGPVTIGGTTLINAGALLEVQCPNATANPAVFVGSSANSQLYSIRLRNSVGLGIWGVSNGVNGFITGTIAGDHVFQIGSASKSWHIGGSVSTVQVNNSNQLGFFSTTPVSQQNGTGNVHTVAAGSVTNVFTNTTFDGSTGSTAYTVGDIIKALKAYGLLAA